MKGILITIMVADEDGDDDVEIYFEEREHNRSYISIESALQQIKDEEKGNVEFDLETLRVHGSADADDVAESEKKLKDIAEMTWPDKPNEDGQYVLHSVWSGPMAEGGMDYIFIPIKLPARNGIIAK